MFNVIEFACDGCVKKAETFTDVPLSADAEARLANLGWLVTCIGKRMWHFCPECRATKLSTQFKPQSRESGSSNG